ncbi:MAG: NTP transferase domain-containing protein [Chlorobi bacterium]|nr:NTP transferase domain-containing protein [Chlorobiota bacterium]
MKAFILAAGLGSRLKALTDKKPKALVEVNGSFMLERLINRLKSIGINEIMINVHHHSNLIKEYINSKDWDDLTIGISDESDMLLDTGGAIKHAASFFDGDENVLVHNVDVLSNLDLRELEGFHTDNKNLVSLCVRERDSSRKLIFGSKNELIGWTNTRTDDFKWVKDKYSESGKQLAYSGIYLASADFAKKMISSGKFSIIDEWLQLAAKENIRAFEETSSYWFDLGTEERIRTAGEFLEKETSSMKFLEKIAVELSNIPRNDLNRTLLILPNKRSIIFLKKHLLKGRVNSFWFPDMLSIEDFMAQLSGFTKADPLSIFFKLFNIYRETTGSKARSFSDFVSWAPMIIRDFNDIDLQLANAGEIFRHLSEARAMKEWNLDGSELSEMQLSFIRFYQSLLALYLKLHETMLNERSAYTGFIYRYNSDNIEVLVKEKKWDNYIFANFSALSKSEEKVFTYIKENKSTKIFFDADEYYINEKEHGLPEQEAGKNIKALLGKWGLNKFNYLTNRLLVSDKNINLYAVQSQLAQVKLVSNLLFPKGRSIDLTETAIILADENLIIPLLNSLPENHPQSDEKLNYNVTLGYPLLFSPLKGFISDWFSLIIKYDQHGAKLLNTRSLQKLFLSNVLISGLNAEQKEELKKIRDYFINENLSYIGRPELLKLFGSRAKSLLGLSSLLFDEAETALALLTKLSEILLHLSSNIIGADTGHTMLKEQLNKFLGICKQFEMSARDNLKHLDLQTFSNLFFQLVANYEINLKGEPLSGIQIMGMLETRALDFKNIIIISANEGILPKAASPDTFIPFDIRNFYGLPLPNDRNSVISYHFFRLLQYAQDISIIYNQSSEGTGIGEPSRFIRQIELELVKTNNNISLNKYGLNIPAIPGINEISINKTDSIIEKLEQKSVSGYSPSALNSYISCSLKFYFQYILKIRKEKEIESSVESNTFGSIIHDSLEEFYRDFIGKEIKAEVLKTKLKDLDAVLIKFFEKHYNTKNIRFGQNLLTWEVSKQYIRNFIKSEIQRLKAQRIEIIGLEEKAEYILKTAKRDIKLYGIIDRIEKPVGGNILRIVDYKTGKVEPGSLQPGATADLIGKTKFSKAFQLVFYKFLYENNHYTDLAVEAGIISLRNLSNSFMRFGIKGLDKDTSLYFVDLLNELFDEIYNPDISFSQTEDENNCEYCDFKDICNR